MHNPLGSGFFILFIQSKGRENRYTILLGVALETIRSYSISGIVSSHICWKAVEIYTHVSNKDIGKSGTPLDNLQMGVGEMIKIKDGEVRPERCMCEPCSDIS